MANALTRLYQSIDKFIRPFDVGENENEDSNLEV